MSDYRGQMSEDKWKLESSTLVLVLLLVLDIESINEYEYDDENEEEWQPLLTPETIDIVLF